MTDRKEFIKRALDTTNGFFSTQSEAVAVNPNIWDMQLRDYEEKKLVIAPQAEFFDFRGPGVDYKVTIDEAPIAALGVAETTDVGVVAFTTRYTTFTPTEYASAYQLTRKEAVRAFFNVAERMVKKLGYALAQKKDALAVAEIVASAGNSVIVNGKTATTALTSTDTLNYDSITKAISEIELDLYTPTKLFINYSQKQQLLNIGSINKANEFGTRDAIQNGLIGELFGLSVFASHSITSSSNVAAAIVMGETGTGEQALGYAVKRDPMVEQEYHALGRRWDIVAHEEYDFAVLHADALCLIYSYSA